MSSAISPWAHRSPHELTTITAPPSDEQAALLIKKMLEGEVHKRLGCSAGGAEDIKRHKWFRGLDWAALYNKNMAAPWKPDLEDEYDTSNFDTYDDSLEESGPLLNKDDAAKFDYWHPH